MKLFVLCCTISGLISQNYTYILEDINPSSNTYGQTIGPDYFQGQVTVHYFGHQNWGTCTARVGQLDALYGDLIIQDIDNVKIIAIGQGQYNADNSKWTTNNSIPIVIDPSPNTLWTSWGASQWDLFFLDSNGDYITDFNINPWDYDKIYNTILNLSSHN